MREHKDVLDYPTLEPVGDYPIPKSPFDPCPFLGCTEDRASMCNYPSGANVCYSQPQAGKRYLSIHLSDQEDLCLVDYLSCLRYRRGLARLGSGDLVKRRPPAPRTGFLAGLLQRLRPHSRHASGPR